MPSQFGGVTVDDPQPQNGSRFGGVPLNDDQKSDNSFLSNYGQSFINSANEGRIGLEGLGQSVGKALYGENPQDASEQAGRQADLAKIRSESAESGVQPSGVAGTLGGLAGSLAGSPTSWTPLGEINGVAGLAKAGAKIGGLSGLIQNTDDNSVWSHLLGAGIGAGEGALTSAALGKGGQALAEIPGGVVNRVKGALGDSLEDMAAQSDKNWESATNTIKSANADQVALTPDAGQKILAEVKSNIGNLNNRHSDTQAELNDFEKAVNSGSLTLGKLDEFRQNFGDVISDNTKSKIDGGGLNSDGQKAFLAKKTIMDSLDKLGDTDFSTGNSSQASALKQGINEWARAARYDRVADMLKNADGDPNAIMRGAAKLLKNTNGMNPEEMDALGDLAKRGTGQAIERALGTFGLDWGKTKNMALPVLAADAAKAGGAAYLPGGLPMVAAGTVLRQTGKWAAKGKGQNLLDTIMDRDVSVPARPSIESEIPNSPMLALPAPRINVDRYGTAHMESSTPPLPDERGISSSQSPFTPNPTAIQAAREKFSPAFQAKEAEAATAKKMQEENLWQKNNIAPEKLVSEAAQRFKDAGLPMGELGNALMRFLNDQQGSMPLPRYVDLIKAVKAFSPEKLAAIIPAGIGASALNQNPATSTISDQNMQELQKLKSALPPQANAAPDVQNFAKAESNNNPNAKNPNSSASGLFQFTNKTWADMVKRYGKQTGIDLGDKGNPQAQATMASLYAKDNVASLQKTLGRIPSKPELYMAHVLGAQGAAKLINSNPNQEAIMLFPRQVFDANRDIFFNGKTPRTAAQVYQLLSQKVS